MKEKDARSTQKQCAQGCMMLVCFTKAVCVSSLSPYSSVGRVTYQVTGVGIKVVCTSASEVSSQGIGTAAGVGNKSSTTYWYRYYPPIIEAYFLARYPSLVAYFLAKATDHIPLENMGDDSFYSHPIRGSLLGEVVH